MPYDLNIQLALEDLLADLQYARKHGQLGRLALLAYCDVKRWARQAGKMDVADMALRMVSDKPSLSKNEFLNGIDELLVLLQWHENEFNRGSNRYALLAEMGCNLAIRH